MKNILGTLAVSALLTTASPTTGLAQSTAQTQTSINNCLNKEPLVKKMYDEIIMKKESYRKQKEGRIDELCNIMAAARKTYSKDELSFIIKNGIEGLDPVGGKPDEGAFTALLAILDKNGTTEAGRDAKEMLKKAPQIKAYYDSFIKAMQITVLVDDVEKRLKEVQK